MEIIKKRRDPARFFISMIPVFFDPAYTEIDDTATGITPDPIVQHQLNFF